MTKDYTHGNDNKYRDKDGNEAVLPVEKLPAREHLGITKHLGTGDTFDAPELLDKDNKPRRFQKASDTTDPDTRFRIISSEEVSV